MPRRSSKEVWKHDPQVIAGDHPQRSLPHQRRRDTGNGYLRINVDEIRRREPCPAVHALWASRLTLYFAQRYHETKEGVKAIPADNCFVALV